MKKNLLSMIALVCTMSAHAQLSDGVSATLQTGENTTIFYGFDAFKDAITAAPSNAVSVITLSPGTFNNPGEITKKVKIYGAGFQEDIENNVSETRVNGELTIKSNDEATPTVRVEGVYFVAGVTISGTQKISDTEIVKCSFNSITLSVESNNTIIRQSYNRGFINGNRVKASGFITANSYVAGRIYNFGSGSDVAIVNCVMTYSDSYYNARYHGPYFYKNNIIGQRDNGSIDGGATCQYNVGCLSAMSCGGNNIVYGNYDTQDWASLFADGQNNLNYTTDDGVPRTWVLAEPTKYVGSDGTPCGVTGGDFPWNPIPATPRIISTSVDAKSEAGKLKVTIKAEARPIE